MIAAAAAAQTLNRLHTLCTLAPNFPTEFVQPAAAGGERR